MPFSPVSLRFTSRRLRLRSKLPLAFGHGILVFCIAMFSTPGTPEYALDIVGRESLQGRDNPGEGRAQLPSAFAYGNVGILSTPTFSIQVAVDLTGGKCRYSHESKAKDPNP